MSLNGELLKELNEQIKHEFYSAYYYLSMSAYFEEKNLSGAASFFRLQSQEEQQHAMKLYDYIIDRGSKVRLHPLDAPKMDFESPVEALELALEHEKFITRRIYDLMNLALAQKEHATVSLLNWFVDEQVEEEALMDKMLSRMKMAGEMGQGLLMIDHELGKRSAVSL